MKDERMKRHYLREEEFLDEFFNQASAASLFMGDEWNPDYECNDEVRKQRRYFWENGGTGLVFDSASVYVGSDGFFSSVQIILRSSERVVTLRVDGNQKVEKIVDKKLD